MPFPPRSPSRPPASNSGVRRRWRSGLGSFSSFAPTSEVLSSLQESQGSSASPDPRAPTGEGLDVVVQPGLEVGDVSASPVGLQYAPVSALASARWVSATPGRVVFVGGSEADVGPAVVGIEDGVQRDGQTEEVAVVDSPVVELLGQFRKRLGPVSARERQPRRDLHSPLDYLDCRVAGGCGPRLLPGAVTARGRAPLRDRSPASRSDRPTAPPTGRRSSPSCAAVDVGAGRRRASRLRRRASLLNRRPLDVLTSLPLALASSSSVRGAAADSHVDEAAYDPPVTRHHELLDPR